MTIFLSLIDANGRVFLVIAKIATERVRHAANDSVRGDDGASGPVPECVAAGVTPRQPATTQSRGQHEHGQ